jgi:hypothetical protein
MLFYTNVDGHNDEKGLGICIQFSTNCFLFSFTHHLFIFGKKSSFNFHTDKRTNCFKDPGSGFNKTGLHMFEIKLRCLSINFILYASGYNFLAKVNTNL